MDIEVLDGEEWWASEAIDDTDRVIKHVLDISKLALSFGLSQAIASDLCDELGKHSVSNNADLNVEKWLLLCKSLRNTEIANQAIELEASVNMFINKHLPSTARNLGLES